MWEIVGKAAVAGFFLRLAYSILKGIYGSFLASNLGLNTNFRKLGKWAVITGATDGIGKAYAFEMAKKGLNIVLISRTPFKLQNVAAEISQKYKVETKIIDVDFTCFSIYDRIKTELEGMDIGLLVNNVGMSLDFPEYFCKLDDQLLQNLVGCNVMSVTMMTKIILPGMQERKRGMIINVSSLSSLIPAPFLTPYAATKAYVTTLSKSLSVELEGTGVSIQCIFPGYVVSNMSKLRRATLMAPTPMTYVRSTLATTGVENMSAGYYMHKLEVYGIELLQQYFPSFILNKLVYDAIFAVRRKYFKKHGKTE